VRHFGSRLVYAFYPKEKIDSLPILREPKKRNTLTLILFAIPGTPKDLLTYFIGLTPMKLHTFLLLTVPARLPSLLSSTLTGGMLGSEKYALAVLLYGITAVLSLVCIIRYRKESKRQKLEEQNEETITEKSEENCKENRDNESQTTEDTPA
jgi:uncharacterized membrane protein YdjX (TVP38/TMEM64 family)